ncbi:MAG: DUF126 domain-containing protein [Phycicoccus sp.]|jgi:predicted aconitase with swiveling domain|uniref:aconitase X swivel domain-containing protein n=1 Tax=Phycicoccus sp. TaxID=1902410 RepID=UPI00258E64D2|nr:DUF126 domain-containing protein [Phycicoccus sp.]MCB9405440.1 DUF126 domain-containing protein [Tetrasphaera sp.]MCO5302205.1 DUF126 domain-containing protein [Phycicoccus sp.]
MTEVRAHALTRGEGSGPMIRLAEPVSFWGGVDHRGTIIDRHHPDHGVKLSGAVLVMTGGRGSSSATSVLAELVRTGNGPVAIILEEADAILALAALVADELYAIALPIVRVQSVSDLPWVDEVVTVWSDVSTGRAGIRQ